MSNESLVAVVRHGEVYGTQFETPLIGLGRQQTFLLADKLKRYGLTNCPIFTSPYRRTCQTAEILQYELSCESITMVPELSELNAGHESLRDAANRGYTVFSRLRVKHPNFILVTHGIIVQGIIGALMNRSWATIECDRGAMWIVKNGQVISYERSMNAL